MSSLAVWILQKEAHVSGEHPQGRAHEGGRLLNSPCGSDDLFMMIDVGVMMMMMMVVVVMMVMSMMMMMMMMMMMKLYLKMFNSYLCL